MIYWIECKECRGSGRKYIGGITGITDDPLCKGKGGFNLAVEVPSKHEGGTGYYRPLTAQEVEDVNVHTQRDGYKPFNRCDKSYLISQLGSILITYWYKGQPVKLMPATKPA